jgi:hypothetical protein
VVERLANALDVEAADLLKGRRDTPNIHDFAIKPSPELYHLLPSENRMLVPPS